MVGMIAVIVTLVGVEYAFAKLASYVTHDETRNKHHLCK
jgi:hypothetical protein